MHARLVMWSLRHRRGRHVLNALATAITAAVVVAFLSVLLALLSFTRVLDDEYARMLITPKLVTPGMSTDGLPVSLYSQIERIPGVKVVQRKLVIAGKAENGAKYSVGGEEDSGVELNHDFVPVSKDVVEAWKKERPLGAIVTENTAKDLRLSVGQTAEIPTGFGPLKIKVVGISHGALFPNGMNVHFDYIQQFTKNTSTCGYRVFTAPADLDRVAREIGELTKNTETPAQGVSGQEFRANLAKQASTVPVVLGFLGLFLLFTTALTLANNTAISIRERRIEVATFRVLGYYPRTISRLLVIEAVIVGLIGGLVGVGVMVLLFRAGLRITPGEQLPKASITPTAIIAGLVVSILVPLAGSLPSARAAVRRPLVEGLREFA